jgi:hypothetical protein
LLASPKNTTTHSNTERLRKLNSAPQTQLPATSTNHSQRLPPRDWLQWTAWMATSSNGLSRPRDQNMAKPTCRSTPLSDIVWTKHMMRYKLQVESIR